VVGAEGRFQDLEGARVERLRLVIAFLAAVEVGQIVEAGCDLGMDRPQGRLAYRERL
jgi:hypothetical protein